MASVALSLAELPDLAIESILTHLLSERQRVQMEVLCRRWRQIGLSMWKRVRQIEVGEMLRQPEGRTLISLYHQHSHDPLRVASFVRQSDCALDFLLRRLDFDRLWLLSLSQVVVGGQKLLELLARCNQLQALHLLNVCALDGGSGAVLAQSVQVRLSAGVASRLRSVVVCAQHVELDLSPLIPGTGLLVALGLDQSVSAEQLAQLLHANAGSLQALRCSTAVGELVHQLLALQGRAAQAESHNAAPAFPRLRHLRVCVGGGSCSAQQLRCLLGMLPADLCELQLRLVGMAPAELWAAVAESSHLLQLHSLAVDFDLFANAELVEGALSVLIGGRQGVAGLAPLRLLFNLLVSASLRVPLHIPSSYRPSPQLRLECQNAQVELERAPLAQWPSIEQALQLREQPA